MNSRLTKFRQFFLEKKCDSYLVVNTADISYLTGYPSSDAWLLATPKKTYYITDGRYVDEVRQSLGRCVTVKQFKNSLIETIFALLKEKSLTHLGFDEGFFSVAQFKKIKLVCPKGIKLCAENGLVSAMRQLKDQQEIDLIRKCLRVNLDIYRHLKNVVKPGMTEREIYFKAEDFVRSKGVRFSFMPIIASGPNSAFPHSKISKRKLRSKDLLLIDLGIQIQGYKSDLTRIFVSSKITKPVERAYWAVAEAQAAAIAEIRAGVSVARIDETARKSLKENKLDKFFVHGTGHGVGLDIHEPPRLSVKSSEILRPGMIITVEPGVYFAGKFGIRIEDMVLVKEKGCEILSRGREVEPPIFI